MATGNQGGQHGSEQEELDLGSGVPSPASHQQPLDRIFVKVPGGSTDIRVKGDLERVAELAVLYGCSLLSALVFGRLSRFAQVEGAAFFVTSGVAFAATFLAGALFLLLRRRSSRRTRRKKGSWRRQSSSS